MKTLSESIALFLVLITSLARSISPNPNEAQRVLPWPSWIWQRLSLFISFPLASLFFLSSFSKEASTGMVLAATWLFFAFYGGIASGWLRATQQTPLVAKLACATAVVAGWTSIVVLLTVTILYTIALALFLVAIFVIAREAIKTWVRKLP